MILDRTWKQVFKPSGTDGAPASFWGVRVAPAGVIIGGRATQLGLECPPHPKNAGPGAEEGGRMVLAGTLGIQ